jgi:hypothetical protein
MAAALHGPDYPIIIETSWEGENFIVDWPYSLSLSLSLSLSRVGRLEFSTWRAIDLKSQEISVFWLLPRESQQPPFRCIKGSNLRSSFSTQVDICPCYMLRYTSETYLQFKRDTS